MADILHKLMIDAPVKSVFAGVATTEGLDVWWTKNSNGKPGMGNLYTLDFGPGYNWKTRVTKYIPDAEFELQMTVADDDWTGTKIGFRMRPINDKTELEFYHSGWKNANEHFRISSYCWAMYLRLLKRFAENGERTNYEERLSV